MRDTLEIKPSRFELQLEQAHGLDENALLCIRHGASRQLLTVGNAMQRPIALPRSGSGSASNVKVDLLGRQGSAWLVPHVGQDKYSLSLGDGEFGEPRSLDVVVRRSDVVVSDNGSSSSSAADDSSKRTLRAADAKDYLTKHDLPAFMQAMTHAVLREKPQDPFAFMASQLPSAAPEIRALQESNALLREQLFTSETENKRLERELKAMREELQELRLKKC